MAFSGCEFSFNGRPSREFGMVVYDLDSHRQDETFRFASAKKILEDRLEGRSTPLTYGRKQGDPMQFTLVFGPKDEEGLPNFLDRWDMERIANWLTAPQGYSWLEIEQPDLQDVRYRCAITELESISFGMHPLAFQCTVTCDSPYAYSYPEVYSLNLTGGEKKVLLKNRSTGDEFYYPRLEIETNGGTEFSIVNHSIDGEEFALQNLPPSIYQIFVDAENEVITTSLDTLNPYECFNFCYLRLRRGDNVLSLKGHGLVKIICEFPRNIGG